MGYFDDLVFVNHGLSRDMADRQDHRCFDYYGVQFHSGGRLEFRTGDSDWRTVEGPHLFFTFPGISFSYGAPGREVRTHYHICFQGERVNRYLAHGLLRTETEVPLIRILDADRLRCSYLELFRQLEVPGGDNHGRAVLRLEELLLQIYEQPDLAVSIFRQYATVIGELRDRVAAEPERQWLFDAEAAKLSVSPVHFRRLFKSLTGLPPGGFLCECRMRRAELLLQTERLRVSEVAGLCGFSDEFHFSKMFRKHRGMSPRAYRRLFYL